MGGDSLPVSSCFTWNGERVVSIRAAAEIFKNHCIREELEGDPLILQHIPVGLESGGNAAPEWGIERGSGARHTGEMTQRSWECRPSSSRSWRSDGLFI